MWIYNHHHKAAVLDHRINLKFLLLNPHKPRWDQISCHWSHICWMQECHLEPHVDEPWVWGPWVQVVSLIWLRPNPLIVTKVSAAGLMLIIKKNEKHFKHYSTVKHIKLTGKYCCCFYSKSHTKGFIHDRLL